MKLTIGKILSRPEGEFLLSAEQFWHLAPTNTNAVRAVLENDPYELCMLLNMIYLNKGVLSLQAILANSGTLQQHKDDHSDKIFEKIRLAEFPDCLSRYNCVYLFKSKTDADVCNWFGNDRIAIRCHIIIAEPFQVFEADSKYITMEKRGRSVSDIEEMARRYWGRENTINPCLEVLSDAALFFPDWNDFSKYDLKAEIENAIKTGLIATQDDH